MLKQSLKQQLNLFYLALSFYSRIPVPNTMCYTPELLNKSTRYISLVGLCLACFLSAAFLLLTPLLSISITIYFGLEKDNPEKSLLLFRKNRIRTKEEIYIWT